MIETNKIQNTAGVYCLSSKINGKQYIGSSIDLKRRITLEHLRHLRQGIHSNSHLQRHVNKYGIQDIQVSILELCKKEVLLVKEQKYMDKHHPEFNCCPVAGSRLGAKLTEKQKQQFQGKNNPMYGIKGVNNPRFGTKHTEEAKEKQRGKRPSISGKNNPFYGKKTWLSGLTKETNEKVKEKSEMMMGNQLRKGIKYTEEEKKAKSIAMKKWYTTDAGKVWLKNNTGPKNSRKGIPRSEEVKKRISEACKKAHNKSI